MSWASVAEKIHRTGAWAGQRLGLPDHKLRNEDPDEAPLRAELFNVDQMEQYGRALATRHVIGGAGRQDRLLRRLGDNEQVLAATCALLTTAARSQLRIAPAGEWLLDNYYLIEEQIRTARRHLPRDYSRELPSLAQGPSIGLPRIYDIALAAISHGDGRIDSESLSRVVAAYQSMTRLTTGELWAIPIMLRLALIENLRRVCARLMAARIHLNQAQDWANQMMAMAESDPKSLILVIADMARSSPPMSSAFVAELSRQLQGHGPALALPLTWIEQRLAEASLSIAQLVLQENQQQASDQVSISNSIGSLRLLGAMDWRLFVETQSMVEQRLREDPDGVYAGMDFASRDRYRHVIEYLAKRSPRDEADIADLAIGLAQRSASDRDHRAHVGYYLIDQGLPELEAIIEASIPLTERLRRRIALAPLLPHLGALLLLSLLLAGGLLLPLRQDGLGATTGLLLTGLLLLPASQLATALVNWLASLIMTPQRLPRMDYSLGLPAEQRSLVVIPTLIASADDVEELLEAIEVRFLGNRDEQLFFGLLTDFADADQQKHRGDAALLRQTQEGIAVLNRRYSGAGTSRFFLFHRPRRWNPAERIWMGYERKRGKLAELNALLRGQGHENFSHLVGDLEALATVRYVITLDTDTQLPRDCARQLVGVMAHPLHRPRHDAKPGRVDGGYGILQPRLAASLVGAQRSRYAQLCGSEPGIDPYTRSVSNVYQDLYGEGSFIGKGIYEVDAFERTLRDRFPENRILSHDLLEGCHARSGLLSDIDLFEDYPARYATDVSRQQRWIRGDWQIVQWLLPRVPGPGGQSRRNPLSALSRWKIFDNLRRSLEPAALCTLLLLGWALLPQPWLWTLSALAVLFLPVLLTGLVESFRQPEGLSRRVHWLTLLRSTRHGLQLAGFRLACLPYEAGYSSTAILRTLWRMRVSRRRLLEWSTASGSAPRPSDDSGLHASYRRMWLAPAIAVAALLLGAARPEARWLTLPFAALWLAAPALAAWLSQPLHSRPVLLADGQRRFLRRMARKTWAYFERYVGAEDHWLPPDNVQELPNELIAHRTSPTNIGLSLLANLSAWDLSYLSTGGLLERSRNSFATLDQLPRHLGHFYNWYDSRSLRPLPPRYVSTVDSGNLAGHLLTLRAGLLALPDQPLVSVRLFEGLLDTLGLLAETPASLDLGLLRQLRALLNNACLLSPATLTGIEQCLVPVVELAARLNAPRNRHPNDIGCEWAEAFQQQCRSALDDLQWLAPWLRMPAPPLGLDEFREAGEIPDLRGLLERSTNLLMQIEQRLEQPRNAPQQAWLLDFHAGMTFTQQRAHERIAECHALAQQAASFGDMDYDFLYDHTRHLLAIGYNVDEFRRDSSFYDLLASEARLACFVAIAQGRLPQESWFALGRLRTSSGGEPILVSWSGSMFEYLMPQLVMPSYPGTLLAQTCEAAVAWQIAYGQRRGQPWGISESGYNAVDASLNYQYHAFGVPGLGLKRGLSEDLVVAPYASALALMVAPEAACVNLQKLADLGLDGPYGFYEAIDYTPSRLAPGQTGVVVRSFMAHHQGMSLLAIAQQLLGRPMQQRFQSDPQFQATLLLLQERIPKNTVFQNRPADATDGGGYGEAPEAPQQAPIGARTATPEVQLLSNGRYHVMLSNAGGGYSCWKDLAVTRWREDPSCDNWGSFLYLRDVASGEFWSATHQPTLRPADHYEALFARGRAEFRRRDAHYESHSEILVSPEDDIELRRLRISNRSPQRRTLEITSYAEVVLASAAADLMQPAFGKLFVQTEILSGRRAILCTRRPRSVGETTPWMFHLLASNGSSIDAVSYETDRMRFLGRGRTGIAPQAMDAAGELSGSQGSVLDPIVAIRCRLTLEAEQLLTLDWVTGIADSREACLALVDKYQDRHLADRVFDLAWTHHGVTLRQINASESDAQLYRRLAAPVLYANAALRADAALLIQNRRGQSGLWGYAISGDLPIVLLKIGDSAHIDLARQMIQCHAYWRLKGLSVDLVIWNEDHVGYRQRLQDQILGLIATGTEANAIDRPGGIFVRSAEQISAEDRILLQAVARVIIADSGGSLSEQLARPLPPDLHPPRLLSTRSHRPEPQAPAEVPSPALILGNPLGGFSADGSEYTIHSSAAQRTPLPWVNVLANPQFGSVISESGLAYTWSENAHEFRLTPWSDDSVGASGGEAIYLRDQESGHYWSPTPLPAGSAMPYRSRHGFGYSVFEHTSGGIHSELWVYVDLNEAVKFSVLKLRNGCGRARQLSATAYVEWVLGDARPKTAMHVVTEIDAGSGALFARNAYHSEFGGRVAFLDVDDMSRTLTGDRREFLGRNGSLANPAALSRQKLSGRVGAALDPCGAVQVPFDLADGQEHEIIFRLGSGHDLDDARQRVQRFRRSGSARKALDQVRQHWLHTLDCVQVETPDPALNVLANGWLLYQTLGCRLWARSGYSQSGGAFGFRDQLQDVMALVHAEPQRVREHLLLSASRQYPEGDVQHWWHPPAGHGVRTRCSDDYLWLPLAICRYVTVTGDSAVLDEPVPYIEGRALGVEEESHYGLPQRSPRSESLYQHAVRALDHGLRFGEHGLPLMGSGDWNDGMDQVGIHGRGESVWLGFFLHEVLQRFAGLADGIGDKHYAQRCRIEAQRLGENLAVHAWDGAWYRRAWFDDGQLLGSAINSECRIDSISQSWSVLSGAADPLRAQQAMDSLDEHLVRREQGLVRLLDPPFDRSNLNPGYIKGYVPGVRENGGQYTHAAIWAAMAFAKLGDQRRAWELLALINPVNHGRGAAAVATYKAEPYVVAADVYAVAPHTGRAGWTWYTGSAGWLYRLITESLLGLRREGDRLYLEPCIPPDWPSYDLRYRHGDSRYCIRILQSRGAEANSRRLVVDGIEQSQAFVTLIDDRREHAVELSLRLRIGSGS